MAIDEPDELAPQPKLIVVAPVPLTKRQAIALGLGCALFGLFPWLITGMRLPLQNLWHRATLPDDMPRVLLPMNQYAITTLVGLIVVAYVAAAFTRRILEPRLSSAAVRALVVTIVCAQLFSILQTTIVVIAGIRRNVYGWIYTFGMAFGLLVAVGYGLLAYRLLVDRSSRTISVGIALAAVPLAGWLNALFSGAITSPTLAWPRISFVNIDQLNDAFRLIGHFVISLSPAIVVGIAIGWMGMRTAASRRSAIVALIINWLITGIAAMIWNVAGYRVYWGDWLAMARVAFAGLRNQLFGWYSALIPVMVSIAIAGFTIAMRLIAKKLDVTTRLEVARRVFARLSNTDFSSESDETLRLAGHHTDFDELAWYQTYRAVAAAQDDILPQSEAEARFVDQMLGKEPILIATPAPARLTITPALVATVLAIVVGAIVIGHQLSSTQPEQAAPIATATPTAAPTPTNTLGPNYSLAPYDRRAVEVIAEALEVAADANPGIIWFGSQQPTLSDCTLPNGHPGQSGALTIRWSMGDFDAIRGDAVQGNTEWHLIQQANDQADDKMLEAWIGEPVTPESATRFGIDSLHGNWYFGYVFPGIAGGSSTFDLDDGVGILELRTLCLQP